MDDQHTPRPDASTPPTSPTSSGATEHGGPGHPLHHLGDDEVPAGHATHNVVPAVRARRVLVGSVAAALVVGGGLGAGAVALADGGSGSSEVAQGSSGGQQGAFGGESSGVPGQDTGPGTSGGTTEGGGGAPGGSSDGSAGGPADGFGGPQGSTDQDGTSGSGSGTSGSTTSYESVAAATDAQSTGVVVVQVATDEGEAAGTGVVLTSSGEVVTNAHVVEGATQVVVTLPSTGESYRAEVVGESTTSDIAVLQLEGASGLATATWDDDDDPAVGDDVTAVGNAGGRSVLVAASGDVTQLDASITTSASQGETSESLSGLIVVDADVVAGDSGGALLDDEDEVVGITTAASSGTRVVTGYAIPAGDVLSVVHQILARVDA
ncbi:S1C family serine protease [Luteimicrobium subarcticum]|uniref:Trypsin-like peptidase n=1 Tax=Luteimicrobium subarcticum TaxID=620910 RepID=A0A2M8WUF1_9MICO|nr:trypsin-like peptidase domain-containing protein [Luteimicrobium subarcticum]PJI94553.1 trypsin-like peptidase [Luteimicrobium subarcticum]